MPHSGPLFLGIDFGTSACRLCAIDEQNQIRGFSTRPLPAASSPQPGYYEQSAQECWDSLRQTLAQLSLQLDLQSITRIAIDGTSASLLLCDASGTPLTPLLMYNDQRAQAEAIALAAIAPTHCAAVGASSSLAKLLYLQQRDRQQRACYAMHQADWLTAQLTGQWGISDENNSLKLGYDPERRQWPNWLQRSGVRIKLLPQVIPPGTPIGTIQRQRAAELGLAATTQIVAGTTDSTAAFIAAGAQQPGEAVTTLGSTLVLKIRSPIPLFSAQDGIYSHRLGNDWLVGGASNSGGTVLRYYFSQAQLDALTPRLNPAQPTGLNYYPLLTPGERFPINDPHYPPQLHPRPADDLTFFQGLLEGIARIEQQGYQRLHQLGIPYPQRVYSAGGGAKNPAWQSIRQHRLGVPVQMAVQTEAAFGCALLARGWVNCAG